MDQDEEMMTLPSTSSIEKVLVDEGVNAAGAPTTSKKIQREAAAVASAVANEVTNVFATEEQFRAVFLNRVIAHNVMSYLNFGDMKSAREVSRSFSEMIELHKPFKDAQVLLLTGKMFLFREIVTKFLLESDRTWRGIKIDVGLLNKRPIDIPRHILKNVEFVTLVSEHIGRDDPAPIRAIRDILKSTRKISHLQIDLRLIGRNLKDVFRLETVKRNLRNVKHFDVLGFINFFGDSDRIFELHCGDISDADYHSLAKNLLYLANSDVCQCLENLHMLKMSLYGHGDRKGRFTRALMELLRRNLGTLRKVSLHLDVWENDDILTLTIPHLDSLTAAVRIEGQDRFRDFLMNHPTLEELDVAVEKKLNKGLFDVIKQRSINLKKLLLRATNFVDLGGHEQTVDWTFLGEMKRLTGFEIVRPTLSGANWQTYGNGTRLLEHLPKNQLERLCFRAIGADHCGFWRLNDLEQENIFGTEPELPYKLELLSGFRNLKCIVFRRCLDAVDDDIMRFIVTEMTSLEEMEISHCSRLTDSGIAGKAEDGSDSIQNLKGLKKLSIRYCPLVTPEGLLSCLKLQFLRRLDYYLAERRVPKSLVLEIISQNPSLESVSINMEYPKKQRVDETEAEMKREINNPRFTKFVNVLDFPKPGDRIYECWDDYY